jgi:hypothetical protein
MCGAQIMICYTNKWKVPFQIDEEDYELISHYVWYWDSDNGYISTHIRKYHEGIFIGGRTIYLHEFLLGKAGEGLEWDHVDQNKLNNCRDNIRIATYHINRQNVGLRSDNITGYPGIYKRDNNRYRARIIVFGEQIPLGTYGSLEMAIKARREAELKYWGKNYLPDPCEKESSCVGL